ncbi:Integrase family protein (modular protein) [Pseudodesulfovibrio profundus]|uniref:Integrase family protein (Modular protein) n=1 Tax=Pseudodesulfovibrio profundus TaxID=57320 RepID=A0A2C8FCQ1_9BACT|nr:tyrosine-type recombinase/integrase [Pseudodesulfovibrio profundus]SOB60564.1 Integrase family protein (modular protein) [Pseudodesulfovibrio profundus]
MDRWLKMGAACKAANCHRDTMMKWIRDGHVVAEQRPAGKRMDWVILERSLNNPTNEFEIEALALLEKVGPLVDVMAISKKPFKVSGKTSWYYRVDKRRLSLGTNNYSKACKLLGRMKDAYLSGKLDHLLGECSMTLGEFKNEYEPWAEETQPTKTFKANMLALKKVIGIEGESQRLDRLTMRTMDELKRLKRESKKKGEARKPLKPTTINNYIRHAKAVLNKAVDWGYLKANPFRGAKELPKGKRVEFLDPGKSAEFLNKIKDVDVRRFAAACISTGRRRSEIFRLTWDDILWDDNKYFIAKEKRHLCKTYPMSTTFKVVLQSMPRGKGRIFDRWAHPDTYTHKIKEAMCAAGVGHLRLHDLRHSFAVDFLDKGGNIKALQELLGHSEFRLETSAHPLFASVPCAPHPI